MADVSKVYSGSVSRVFVRTNAQEGVGTDLGLIDEGNFTLKMDPVTRKNSNHEQVITQYDVKFELNLQQVKDLDTITPLNNQVKEILLDDEQGQDTYVKIMALRLNVGVGMDFGDVNKSAIKITGSKRIPASDINNVINFHETVSGQQ